MKRRFWFRDDYNEDNKGILCEVKFIFSCGDILYLFFGFKYFKFEVAHYCGFTWVLLCSVFGGFRRCCSFFFFFFLILKLLWQEGVFLLLFIVVSFSVFISICLAEPTFTRVLILWCFNWWRLSDAIVQNLCFWILGAASTGPWLSEWWCFFVLFFTHGTDVHRFFLCNFYMF